MMAKTRAFDENARAYDDWFEAHESLYASELEAIRSLLPKTVRGIEIGVGTGRFAEPLGIKVGIEPSPAMRALARERGIDAIDGVAEELPIESETFDYVLFVTTVCFLESLHQAFSEAMRILTPNGAVMIGFIEKESALGRLYQQRQADSRFYREASFHTVAEIIRVLELAGFGDLLFSQTLFPGEEETGGVQAVKEGYGEGAFVVVRAIKPGNVSTG
jgi:SAM-dependent methyltransferase